MFKPLKHNHKQQKSYQWWNLCQSMVAIILGVFSVQLSHATITVQKPNGGSLGGKTSGGGIYYYYVTYTDTENSGDTSAFSSLPDSAFITFSKLNLAILPANDTSFSNYFQFDVFSDKALNLGQGQTALLTMQLYALGNNSTANDVSFAAVDGQICTAALCQSEVLTPAYSSADLNGSNARFYALPYQEKTTVRIGFYPSMLCLDLLAANSNGLAEGCTSDPNYPVKLPPQYSPKTFRIGFQIYVASKNGPTGVKTGSALDSTSAPITLSMGQDYPKISCPTASTLNSSYTVADGAFGLDTGDFGLVNSKTGTGLPLVPKSSVSAFGYLDSNNQGSSVLETVTASTYSDYSPVLDTDGNSDGSKILQNGIIFGNNQMISGLSNSTSSSSNKYYFTFAVQDQAGVYAAASDYSSCYMGPIEVSQIEGFLANGKCFIATAVFGSQDAPPVRLLRQFRDEVLLQISLGKAFVAWYYDWSPTRAEWLLEHPIFRLPLVVFFLPITLIVWLWLNPGILLFGLGFLVLGLSYRGLKKVYPGE